MKLGSFYLLRKCSCSVLENDRPHSNLLDHDPEALHRVSFLKSFTVDEGHDAPPGGRHDSLQFDAIRDTPLADHSRGSRPRRLQRLPRGQFPIRRLLRQKSQIHL